MSIAKRLSGFDAGRHQRRALQASVQGDVVTFSFSCPRSRSNGTSAEAKGDLDQSSIVGPCVAEADEIGDHAIDGTRNSARTVRSRCEAAAPEIVEQGIIVIGLLLGTEFRFR